MSFNSFVDEPARSRCISGAGERPQERPFMFPIKITTAAKTTLHRSGIDVATFGTIVDRLTQCVPHIVFGTWYVSEDEGIGPPKETPSRVHWADSSHRTLHCHLRVGTTYVATEGEALTDAAISNEDVSFIGDLSMEAANVLDASRRATFSLTDFGAKSIAGMIGRLLGSDDKIARDYIRSLRSVASETYENRRIPYGLLLTRRPGSGRAPVDFDNKRFKRLTDGFSTALMLDREGGIMDLHPLHTSLDRRQAARLRPWWLGPLADTAALQDGVGVALTMSGDILVAHGGDLLASQRGGRWRIWRHRPILDAVYGSWDARGPNRELYSVLMALYRVALELAFRRSGGLLVVATSRRDANAVIQSAGDQIGSKRRATAELGLDQSLLDRKVQTIDRRVVADLSSLDGALVVDRTGLICGYGAMVRTSGGRGAQGARTRAAVTASQWGLAIKVSSDGGITFYRSRRVVAEIG